MKNNMHSLLNRWTAALTLVFAALTLAACGDGRPANEYVDNYIKESEKFKNQVEEAKGERAIQDLSRERQNTLNKWRENEYKEAYKEYQRQRAECTEAAEAWDIALMRAAEEFNYACKERRRDFSIVIDNVEKAERVRKATEELIDVMEETIKKVRNVDSKEEFQAVGEEYTEKENAISEKYDVKMFQDIMWPDDYPHGCLKWRLPFVEAFVHMEYAAGRKKAELREKEE